MRPLHPLPYALAVALLAGTSAAQVDFVYSNISGSRGDYTDALVLWTTAGQRPFVSEANVRGATNSPRKPKVRDIGGKKYVYWINTFRSDALQRGTDANGNGVVDATEIEEPFKFNGNVGSGAIDERGGTWAVGVGIFNSASAGVYSMKDGNGDGDFKDANEANQLVKGPSIKVGPTTYSSDDVRGMVALKNGDFVWHEDDANVWFRTTPAGQTSLWLVYNQNTRVISGPKPALNSDWANGRLPAISGSLDRAAYDGASGTVFLTVCFRSSEAIVFSAKDANNDGDVNDAGEVRVLFDGTKQSPAWGPVDDIEWLNGAIYGSYEIDTRNDPGSQFWKLQGGTFSKVGRTATTDDPTMLGLTVVPAGTFAKTCANAVVQNDSDLSSTSAGTVKLNVKDIPAALRNEGTQAFAALSLTGDGPFALFGCTFGITPDALTASAIDVFQAGPITAKTLSLPDLNYPAGLPVGTKIRFMAFFVRFRNPAFRGLTGTGLMQVK